MQLLWLFICFWSAIILQVDSQIGCSFSSDDWCDYTNVFDGTNGPQWLRAALPVQENFQTYIESRRSMRLNGNHPMEWPPKGDNYLYTGPTRSNTLAKKFAELKSPAIVINDTGKCLYFSYHNRIPIKLTPTLTVRRLNVGLYNSSSNDQLGESEDENLAEFYSLESSKWFEAQVALPLGEYHLIFSGRNYNDDMIEGGILAISSIAIVDESCGSTVAEWLRTTGDCDFEDNVEHSGYSYTNDSTVKLLNIFAEYISAGEQNTKSSRIRQRPTGLDDRFLAMTSEFHEIANHGDKARLKSPEITIRRNGCMNLWYYNSVQSKTDANNALNIIQRAPTTVEKLLFRLPIPKTDRDRWHQLHGSLPRGTYRLIIEVLYTSDFAENDFVAFDNIEIFNKSCSDVKTSAGACSSEDNENGGHRLCGTGGSCVETGKKSFRCVCKDSYYGSRCEHQYLCTPNVNPCRNGGTCFPDGRMDYRCFCQTGYNGKSCEEIQSCGSPENAMEHTRVVSFTNETYGSTSQLECIDGWVQIGDLVSTCMVEGNWKTRGACLFIRCDYPPIISDMTLVNITNTTYKGQATYRCQDGLTTYENDDYLTCEDESHDSYDYLYLYRDQFNNFDESDWKRYANSETRRGQWVSPDGSSELTCHPIPNCGQPPIIANAKVTVTSTWMHGVATYRCNSGYELNNNQSSAEMICSQHGRWINKAGNINIQCFVLPDCGPPPEIPFGVVNYTKTSIDNTASYQCKAGYRLIGIDSAGCWRISENRLEKWVDWLFVPKCELSCPVKVGRHGNITVAKFQVSICRLSGFESIYANLSCGAAVPYAVRRTRARVIQNDFDGRIRFYGADFCIAEKVQKVKSYDSWTIYDETKCVQFCLRYPFEVSDIVVLDELRYARAVKKNAETSGSFHLGQTTREQKIVRYVSMSP